MGMTEKESLINSITIQFAEEFNLPIKTTKAKLSEILQQYHITISDESMAGNDLSTEYLLKKFSDGKSASGIENLTCHTFRRFYATELRKRDVNIQLIASSLGHANLNQINRYSLYNNSEMLDIIRNAI